MDTPSMPQTTTYEDNGDAPLVYFDISAAHGVMNGAIQIELASRVLVPGHADAVDTRFRATGHLRCSPAAAMHLRDSLNAALKMLDQPQQMPSASAVGSTLN